MDIQCNRQIAVRFGGYFSLQPLRFLTFSSPLKIRGGKTWGEYWTYRSSSEMLGKSFWLFETYPRGNLQHRHYATKRRKLETKIWFTFKKTEIQLGLTRFLRNLNHCCFHFRGQSIFSYKYSSHQLTENPPQIHANFLPYSLLEVSLWKILW